jgi:tRNA dimethylallyltransferase
MKSKTLAIIGPTASGKSDLALNLAKKINAIILSVDSLSVYKEIDIASAKPSLSELKEVKHFGINLVYPSKQFDVTKFIKEFEKAKEYANKEGKNLIIVGGSSFYLKTLIEGISKMPKISEEINKKVELISQDLNEAYNFLNKIDSDFAKKIKSGDSYRIKKALQIFFATNLKPSVYFKQNPKKPIFKDLRIYEILVDREVLRKNVQIRTKKMFKAGLIDEVCYLEAKYTRAPNALKAIGIKEILEFLDGKLTKQKAYEQIVTNTMRLAKRQVTFNKTQLNVNFCGSKEDIFKKINV